MSSTYRPALVCAGQAIMQGKLVFSQSLSTFLSTKRCSIIGLWVGRREGRQDSTLPPPRIYLLSVKSAEVSPATLTGLDLLFAPSCHAVTVYAPSGTLSILNSPDLSVSAK